MLVSAFREGSHELGDCGRGQKLSDAGTCISVCRTVDRLANMVNRMQGRHLCLCCREAIGPTLSLEFNVFIQIPKARSYHPADN